MRRSGSSADRVVVANPSSNPETLHAASALARADRLSRYYVPVAVTPAQSDLLRRALPARVAGPVLQELRRRPVPDDVPTHRIRRVAAVADLQRVAASRLGRPLEVRTRLAHQHRAVFDHRVATRLRREDGGLLAVLGSATETVRTARNLGVRTFLDNPIAHHGWIRDLMREEARLVPDYAVTLQGHDFPDEIIAAHVEELELADHLLVLSTHAWRTLVDRGVDEAKMTMTPLGVDLELFQPCEPRADGTFRVLFVGQISQRKGISYLIDAFRRASIPRSELVFVGEVIGSSAPWIGQPGVRHVPPRPRAELPALYGSADVYVLPSLAEGFPLTAMEAMACGLPVILSDHTFAGDVVTDGTEGYVVPIRDPDAIAERLRLLAADEHLRRQMGAAARRRAEDFPWHRYGQCVVDLIGATLNSRRGHV